VVQVVDPEFEPQYCKKKKKKEEEEEEKETNILNQRDFPGKL
jgi:hypothetical protein